MQSVCVKPEDYQWVQSPASKIERVMLDRIGQETARATSIVKYAENSVFPSHQHPLGEEILVLSGIFTENGQSHYPAGWYLRNPHHSSHQPSSEHGCTIFVKLRQMTENEVLPVRINTLDPENWTEQAGQAICPLFDSIHEKTYLQKFQADQHITLGAEQGCEILVISGLLTQINQNETFPAGSWIRLAPDSFEHFQTNDVETQLYIKSGHLIYAQQMWANIAPNTEA